MVVALPVFVMNGCLAFRQSGFTLADVERCSGARFLIRNLDASEGPLVTRDVVLQCHHEALGMLGCKNDAAAHLCFGHTWEHSREVDDEIAAGVRDDGKVGVFALCYILRELQLETVVFLIVVVHCNVNSDCFYSDTI